MKLWLPLALSLLLLLLSLSSSCEGSDRGQPRQLREKTAALAAAADPEVPVSKPGRRVKRFFYPGTKWCGKGSRATSYEDLGEKREIDKCCRSHDHCDPRPIKPRQTKYGIKNPMWTASMSYCSCDVRFKSCLRSVGSSDANKLGYFFFGYIDKCFRLNPARIQNNGNY